MTSAAPSQRKIITDKLVADKTGRTMAGWFDVLDQKGAKKLDHAAIFDLVASIDGLKPLGQWNQNLLATTYEWDRGLKERGARADGTIEISVSKTIAVPVEVLYAALVDDELRAKWLPDETITFRKATLNKSARITWSDGVTSLSVDFYDKGNTKSQIVVQHIKIPDAETAAGLKQFWAAALDRLRSVVE
jgi:uncharacterized protein YndB with AHSA1/START domain